MGRPVLGKFLLEGESFLVTVGGVDHRVLMGDSFKLSRFDGARTITLHMRMEIEESEVGRDAKLTLTDDADLKRAIEGLLIGEEDIPDDKTYTLDEILEELD